MCRKNVVLCAKTLPDNLPRGKVKITLCHRCPKLAHYELQVCEKKKHNCNKLRSKYKPAAVVIF